MSGGGGKGGGDQTTGYRYYFGLHMGIGRGPVDELVHIKVGDKSAWTGNASVNQDISINQPNLFGGEGKEGGIVGTLQLMMGEPTQTASSGLLAMLGSPLPGFRKMVTAFFDGIVAMNNPYPKEWKFRIRRTLKGWDRTVFRPDIVKIHSGAVLPVFPPVKGILTHFDNTVVGHPNVVPSVFGPPLFLNSFTNGGTFYPESTLSGVGSGKFGSQVFNADGASASTSGDGFGLNFSITAYLNTLPSVTSRDVYFPTSDTQSWRAEGWFKGYGELFDIGGSFGGSLGTMVGVTTISPSSGWPYGFALVSNFNGILQTGDAYGFGQYAPSTTWYHVAVQYDGFNKVLSLFLDGAPVWSGGKNYFGTLPASLDYVPLRISSVCDEFYLRDIANSELWMSGSPNTLPTAPFDIVPPLAFDNTIVAMNPSHIIYECLTNREWGRGLDESAINMTSFDTAAQALHDEQFGLCLKWSRTDSIESFVQTVINHIGATLFTDFSSGLITLRLIRGDYVIDTLPLFDTESGILNISENAVSSPGMGINEIVVTYHDPISDEDKVVRVDNLASIQAANGNVNSSKRDYTGIPTPELALRVAQRDLKAVSLTLRRFTITMDRRGRKIEPGSPIRIRDAKRGIPETVVRVGRVDDGNLNNGDIKITAIQDVFSLPATSYSEPVLNTWAPPKATGCLDVHRAFELPYFMIVHNTTPANLAYIDPAAGYIGTVVAEGQPMNVGYKIAVRDTPPTPDDYPVDGSANYCGFVPDWI